MAGLSHRILGISTIMKKMVVFEKCVGELKEVLAAGE
jgi:hypothetical protein